MGWLIALGVLIIIGCLPVGIKAEYDEDGPSAFAFIGPIRLVTFLKEKKNRKKVKTAATGDKKFASHRHVKKKRGGKLTDFMPLLNVILDFLRDFHHKIKVRILEFKLVMAGDDPCDLSVRYGSTCAAIGAVLPILERAFTIKKRKINVECDFTAEETLVEGNVEIVISLAKLLWFVMFHGSRILSGYSKIMKLTKDGANL